MTTFFLVSGVTVWVAALIWGVTRIGAACDGRKW